MHEMSTLLLIMNSYGQHTLCAQIYVYNINIYIYILFCMHVCICTTYQVWMYIGHSWPNIHSSVGLRHSRPSPHCRHRRHEIVAQPCVQVQSLAWPGASDQPRNQPVKLKRFPVSFEDTNDVYMCAYADCHFSWT